MNMLDDLKGAIGIGHEKADHALGWLAALYQQGDALLSEVQQQNERKNYHRIPGSAIVDANGNAEIAHRVHSGGWHLVSVTISGDAPTATTGAFIYRNDTSDPINLLHVITYGSRASDVFSDGEYIGEQERIIVRFEGQTPGNRVTANLKYLNLVETPRQAGE